MSFLADLRLVLRGGAFRRLYATRLLSQASDGAFQAALASLFFFSPERQTSAGAIALAFAVLLLPYSVVGPFAGVLLDRWRRRQVLVRANLLRTVLVLVVAGLVLGGVGGPILYALVLACLSINRFFLAGLSAALPHVVPRGELVMANSVSTTSGALAALLGGGIGFGARLALGEGAAASALVIVAAAATYLGSAAVAATLHPDALGPDDDGERPDTAEALRGVVRGLHSAARHVWVRRPAALALGAILAHRLAYGLSTIAAILLARNYFNDPQDVDEGIALLGLIVGVSGAGFFLSAVITPAVTERIRTSTWIVVCFLGAAVVEAVYVAALSIPLVLGGAFLLGVAAQGSKICVDTIVQESVADAYRGRVFSFYDVIFNMAFIAAAALAVLLVPPDGYSRLLYGIVAAIYLATALVYRWASLRYPEPDETRLTHRQVHAAE